MERVRSGKWVGHFLPFSGCGAGQVLQVRPLRRRLKVMDGPATNYAVIRTPAFGLLLADYRKVHRKTEDDLAWLESKTRTRLPVRA